MFERYTEQARRVLFFARYEATQLGSLSIEPEHLLLGLIREGKGLMSRIFARSHVSLEDLRKEIEGRVVFREKVSTSVEMPISPEAKRVLQLAAEEADGLHHNYIGAEHLLLGMLREENSVAATALVEKGMDIATAREDLVQFIDDHAVPSVPPYRAHAELRVKLSGYTKPGQELFRNVLFDQMCAFLPKDPQVKVQIYNAEIAPGGYTNWHCHNGATFFVALQGIFEAEFEEGILIKAQAGDVYSEPIGKFHRGHNPHPDLPYLCLAICLTPPDREHVTNVPQRPW